jgi:CRP-like cAMP-binding protein
MGSESGGRRRGAAGRPHARRNSVGDGGGQSAPDGNNRTADAPRRVGAPQWRDGNRILASLPPDELAVVRQNLTSVALASGQMLYPQRGVIEWVYFPDTSVVSLLSRMDDAAVVEVGTIGNEGGVGLSLFLGVSVSVPETIAQIPGDAQRMPADAFQSSVHELPRFRDVVARCTHAFMTQVSQTAACNRLHGIEQRCARWLLLTHDRVGGADTFPLTHQFLSFMLGVRRAGVTEALGALARSALITSGSGHITILDRQGLEAASCECYAIVRRYAGEPFDEPPGVVRLRTEKAP